MTADDLSIAETRHVRARLMDFLLSEGYTTVLEGMVAHDGWRGEFIGRDGRDDVIVTTHKPEDRPWLTLAVAVEPPVFSRQEDLEGLIEVVSDFDLALWFPQEGRSLIHLGARLPLSAVNEHDLEFCLGNLLAGREEVLDRFSGETS